MPLYSPRHEAADQTNSGLKSDKNANTKPPHYPNFNRPPLKDAKSVKKHRYSNDEDSSSSTIGGSTSN